MKVVAKPIEMIALFDSKGNVHPVRFRITNVDKSNSVIKVDRVICIDKEKLAGNYMLVFKCKSVIHGVEKLYELKYELSTCKWVLFKI